MKLLFSSLALLLFTLNSPVFAAKVTLSGNEADPFRYIFSAKSLGYGGKKLTEEYYDHRQNKWTGISVRNDFSGSQITMTVDFPDIFLNQLVVTSQLLNSGIYDIPNTTHMMVGSETSQYPDYTQITYYNYKDMGLILGLIKPLSEISTLIFKIKPFLTIANSFRSKGLFFDLNYIKQLNQNLIAALSWQNMPAGYRTWNTGHKEIIASDFLVEANYQMNSFKLNGGFRYVPRSPNLFSFAFFSSENSAPYLSMEWKTNDHLVFRMGHSRMFIAAGGLTIELYGFKINYGFGVRDLNGFFQITQGIDLKFDLNRKEDWQKVLKP